MVLEDKVHKEALGEDEGRPADLKMVLGYINNGQEYTGSGMISQMNMFYFSLSSARMVALINGSEECGLRGPRGLCQLGGGGLEGDITGQDQDGGGAGEAVQEGE